MYSNYPGIKLEPAVERETDKIEHTYIHTYILYCHLPNGAFQEQLFKLLKLVITIQLKLMK